MLIALSVLLCFLSLLAIVYPLLARTQPQSPVPASATEALDELLARRESAFQALRELDFDHQVGKITDEDFAVFAAHLKRVAAEALKALDEWEATADGELGPTVAQEVAARRTLQGERARPCPSCGHPVAPGDRFCAACGARLPQEY